MARKNAKPKTGSVNSRKQQLVETNRLLDLISWVVDGDDNNDEHLSGKKLPKIFYLLTKKLVQNLTRKF